MAHQIRLAMGQGTKPLTGIVEMDETYFGGKGKQAVKYKNKAVVVGIIVCAAITIVLFSLVVGEFIIGYFILK